MLSFDNYIASSNINLIYKCLHGQAPQVLCDLVQPMQAVGRSTRRAAAGIGSLYVILKAPLGTGIGN